MVVLYRQQTGHTAPRPDEQHSPGLSATDPSSFTQQGFKGLGFHHAQVTTFKVRTVSARGEHGGRSEDPRDAARAWAQGTDNSLDTAAEGGAEALLARAMSMARTGA